MKTPLVSVIITPRNAFSYIREAIQSVLDSSVDDLEILVSPADSFDYKGLKSLFNDNRIVVLPSSIEVSGRGPAKNRALWMARGEYVCTLDADDLWKSDWLEKMLPVAKEHGLAFSATEHFKVKDKKVVSTFVNSGKELISLRDYTTSHTTLNSLAKKEISMLWPDCFGSDAIREMLMLARHGGLAPFVNEALYRVRIHAESETLSSKVVDEAYSTMYLRLSKDPGLLGAANLSDEIIQELLFYFKYRRAVNQAYMSCKRENYTYYEFVRDSKMSAQKLNLKH